MASLMPMLQVPDIRTTVAWYTRIGFAVVDTAQDGGEMTWAMVAYGDGRVMFNCGGHASDAPRRDADLYIEVGDVDAVFAALPAGIVVQEALHDTFYGMRECIVRDNNGFWITFGQRL